MVIGENVGFVSYNSFLCVLKQKFIRNCQQPVDRHAMNLSVQIIASDFLVVFLSYELYSQLA